ncbi:MAG TPA: 4'-phosphopantetheinyl transferase superfamily protein [Polyangiales bacterium]|jgi:4'-phosphopantetheinyl transferase|nr:4'-phosphopantetheinyl transferase superfamily protein [Polyangiales bacterium]
MDLPTFESTPCDALLLHVATAQPPTAAQRSTFLSWFSADERERHDRFHFDSDRDTYLIAHALLRRALAALTGHAPGAFTFLAGEHGRPEIAAPESARSLRFNLSHTRGRVACGFTRGAEIGVDVEQVDRKVELEAVARRVYSDAELQALFALPPEAQRERFFELWTLKESYIKAIGKGFTAPLRAITFIADHPDPVPLQLGAEIADDASSYCCRRHVPGVEHALAAVWRGKNPDALCVVELATADLTA